MKNFKNNKEGFTFVEILLVFTIIGIIAGCVIPLLIQNVQDTYLKGAYKKAYSNLEQATKRIMLDNAGTMKGIFLNTNNNASDEYKKYLDVVKTCSNSRGYCWSNTFYKLNGEVQPYFYMNSYDGWTWAGTLDSPGLALNNGMLLVFIGWYGSNQSPNCSYAGDDDCGEIYMDVNGFKGPNTIGKDIFIVHVTSNGLKPWGYLGNRVGFNNSMKYCDTSNVGYACSSLYLRQ